MADALCGPSNPLQSFQKHTQTNRALQQDRLTGPRHSPAQGFRSADPRAGSLDAEFAAFEAGPQSPFQLQQAFPSHALPLHAAPSLSQFGSVPTGWAADFQKMHISKQPVPAQQLRAEAPLMRSNLAGGLGGWHSDFMKQQQQIGVAQGKQAVNTTSANEQGFERLAGNVPMYTGLPLGSSYGQTLAQGPMQQQNQSGHEQAIYDEAAFEAAFAQASYTAAHMDVGKYETDGKAKQSSALAPSDPASNEIKQEHFVDDATTTTHFPETARIGSDLIPKSSNDNPTSEEISRDADDLARTAGQLLDAVSHETSAKFQGSQFLALMRRIRDGEVKVQGEEFAETSSTTEQSGDISRFDAKGPQDLHPGGHMYPYPHMSGGISAEEMNGFDGKDESGFLASPYQNSSASDQAAFGSL